MTDSKSSPSGDPPVLPADLEDLGPALGEFCLGGMCLVDHDHRVIYANRATIELCGVGGLEQLRGRSFLDFIARNEREKLQQLYDRGEPLARCTLDFIRDDGVTREVEAVAGQVENSQGKWRVYALLDVTEHSRAERGLQESEHRYKQMLELASDYHYELRSGDWTLRWSSSIDRLLGYEPGEFPRDLQLSNAQIHHDDRPRVMAQVEEHFRTGAPFRTEYRLRKKDGSYLHVSSRAMVLRNEQGEPVHWVGVNTDITERKRIEEQLRASEEKWLTFVYDSAYGYVEFDLEGKITLANARAEQIGGVRLDGGNEVNFRDLIIPEDLEQAVTDLGKVLYEPNDGPREYRVRRPSGELIHVSVNTLPLRQEGQTVGFQATILDVTERVQAQVQLQRREALLREVAQAAESFLRCANWRDDIDEILRRVGSTLEIGCIYIYENLPGSGPAVRSVERYEWRANQAETSTTSQDYRVIDFSSPPFQEVAAKLRAGEVFGGPVSELTGPERPFLEAMDIASLLVIPILSGDEWWGFIGFDEYEGARAWPPAEIDALRTLANTLGATINRQRAQLAMQESERKYRLVVETSTDVIWTTGLDLKFSYVSPSVTGLLGYTAEEILTLSPPMVVPPDLIGRWSDRTRMIRQALAEGKLQPEPPLLSEGLEFAMTHKDGRTVWVEASLSYRRDEHKEIVGFQGVLRDITRRKKAEEAMRLNQERLRAQYNAIPVPTYTWTREGDDFILTDFNEAAIKITQGKINDYRGIKASELYQDNPGIRADLERCFSEQIVFEREMAYQYQSFEQQKHLLVKYAFVAPNQVIAHTEDITERKKALEALAEFERRHQQTLSAEVQRRRSKDYSEPSGAETDLQLFRSPLMKRALEEARLAASSDGNVLILGKSGVGKTYLAGWIHQHSSRADGPFFDINCAALTPSLIESELFGHEAGAFTGSKGRKRGLIELAEGGTLFLDEIGDMPLDLQAKLLDFLDTHRFMRVGGQAKIHVDARIMVATNRDLPAQVREGKFREDLYYRLNVLAIMIPTLQERKEDLPLLASEVLHRLAQEMGLKEQPVLGPQAIRDLLSHDWPGNVRELRNILERVLLRQENKSVIEEIPILRIMGSSPETLSDRLGVNHESLAAGARENFDQAVEKYMEDLIREALSQTSTKTDAAKLLGISRHALNRYIKKFNIIVRKTNEVS